MGTYLVNLPHKESSSSLKVIHLDHTVAAGGAELALLRTLKCADWDATLVIPKSKDRRGIFAELRNTRFIEKGVKHPTGASGSRLLSLVLFGARLANSALAIAFDSQITGDVIHANSTRSAIYGAFVAKRKKIPLVVHLRDFVSPESMGKSGFRIYTQYALPAANALIANSQATLESARRYVRGDIPAHVVHSPTGVSRVPVAPTVAETVGTVGIVARLTPWKGQALLITAFADAFGGTGTRLRIVGGPTLGDAAYAETLISHALELGVLSQVDFVGHREDVMAEIDRMDVCVQCSLRAEPLGQNVLQYLARGKPIIVSAEGGPASWIEQGVSGIHFTPRDQASLTEKLLLVASEKKLRQRLADGAAAHQFLSSDREVAAAHRRAFEDARSSWLQGQGARTK